MGWICLQSMSIRNILMMSLLLKTLSKIEQYLIAGLLMFNLAILFITVVLRYGFNNPPVWPEEASRYVMIWIIYLGVSQSIENNTEIKIDILSQLIMSTYHKRVLNMIASVISLVASIFMAWYGFDFAKSLFNSQQIAASFPMAMGFIYLIIPFAGILMAIKFIYRLSTQIRNRESTIN